MSGIILNIVSFGFMKLIILSQMYFEIFKMVWADYPNLMELRKDTAAWPRETRYYRAEGQGFSGSETF